MNTLNEMRQMLRTKPVKALTESQLAVELPENVGEMTVAEVERWIEARSAS